MKRRTARISVYVTSALVFWVVTAPSAHAYIDPGSTNFLIQIVIGAAAGAGLAIATFWRRIRSFFTRSKSSEKPEPQPPGVSGPPPTTPEQDSTGGPASTSE